MDFLAAIILALVQGLTEFLPISSSAHLILVPRFLGWEDQGLAFDVAVHLGTLIAVLWFFAGEIRAVVSGWLRAVTGQDHIARDAQLGWDLLIASLPVVLAGFFLEDLVGHEFRSPWLIAFTTAFFGVLLWFTDLRAHPIRDEHDVGLKIALLIGLAQVLALMPGTSRSGITITAALMLGLSRQSAARFSFLLAIPAIGGASALELWELSGSEQSVDWISIAVGLVIAAVSAYFCIKFFLAAIQRIGMLPFMIYRLILATVIVLSMV